MTSSLGDIATLAKVGEVLVTRGKEVGSSRYLLDILKTLGQDLNIPVQRRDTPSAGTGCWLIVFFAALSEALENIMLRSGEVEAVKVHDFVPHSYKVMQELLLGVLTSVDFRQGPELGVGAEDQINARGGPL